MLKITFHETQDLSTWYRLFLAGHIDMSPSYQRKSAIWGKWKQAHLIDSLINGFDVPKFYLGNFFEMPSSSLNKGNTGYSVIDGKQRLGAIFAFFSDELPLNKTSIYEDSSSISIGGLKYSELKLRYPTVAERVERFIPTVMNVVTDDERKINELFIRLNMGEAANGAEQRNAMGGPIPEIIRELSLHPFFSKKIRFNTGRMQEFNLIAKLLLLEVSGSFVDTKKSDLDDFAKKAANLVTDEDPNFYLQQGPYVEAKERILEVLEYMTPEFVDRDKLLANAGSIPVYYWWAKNNRSRTNEIHDFLIYLTDEIKGALNSQKNNKHADARLLSYYTSSRTTNDKESLKIRYNLFCDLYNNWSKPHPLRRK
jgi:hypothetical protein